MSAARQQEHEFNLEWPLSREDLALVWAVDDQDVTLVRTLLGQGATSVDWALKRACEGEGNEAIVELLLDHGADPNFVPPKDPDRSNMGGYYDSAFEYSAKATGRVSYVRMFASCRDVNAVNPITKMTPLISLCLTAQFRDDLDAMTKGRILLSAGANPNLGDECTPLCEAVVRRAEELVELLLESGANPNGDSTHRGLPLVCACEFRYRRIVVALLEAGAKPNAVSVHKPTTPVFRRVDGKFQMVHVRACAANVWPEEFPRIAEEVHRKARERVATLHLAASRFTPLLPTELLAKIAEEHLHVKYNGEPPQGLMASARTRDWAVVPLPDSFSRLKLAGP